ncbi:MAG: c-type cytochrome, partial [Chloroflexota bacterium]
LTEGSWTRIVDIRLNEPEFADYTAEQYAIESIIHPANYIVPDYENVIMPANYGSRLDAQQLADLLAYLQSQDQVIDEASAEPMFISDNESGCTTEDALACAEAIAELDADAERGESLYFGSEPTMSGVVVGCAGCHIGGVIGPANEGMWTRILDERLTTDELADYTPEQYVIEAIINPDTYISEGYIAGMMPATYAEQITVQDLADMVAYIRTLEIESADASDETASTDVDPMATCSQDDVLGCTEIVAQLTGNDLRGEGLYNGTTLPAFGMALGCAGCHTAGVLGPATEGTWQRTIDERLTLSDFADYSVEQFVIEAIIHPNNYIPEGYTEGVMPGNYAEQLSAQDIADLLAFLRD